MGWASGSELADTLWGIVRGKVQEGDRKEVARKFVKAFENRDCDTIYECDQLVEDAGKDWFRRR